jgi:predicted NBD/HSP70 family sugar kinase
MNVLVIDIGGSHVKFTVWGQREKRRFSSGQHLTPSELVRRVRSMTADWDYDVVSIGFPGLVVHGKPALDPPSLGKGWTKFNFKRGFRRRAQVINDAAMQALGSYAGGRMLFLGLGTGLGSTLILDDVVVPLELGELSYTDNKTLAEVLGKSGFERSGAAAWERTLHKVVGHLSSAFRADYVVLGGGNSKRVKRLPNGTRRGSNDRAFVGGARLWGLARLKAEPRKHTWVLV